MLSIMATFREGRKHLRYAECVRAEEAAHLVTAPPPPVPPMPDVETCSLEALFFHYTQVLSLGYKSHPWTLEALLTLGGVFVRVHGRLPCTRDLERAHFMPSDTVLRTHFGCLSGYNAALSRLLDEEERSYESPE